MTKEERAKALALNKCRLGFCQRSADRFVTSMAFLAKREPETVLTAGQKFYLDLLVYRYRRQLAGYKEFDIPAAEPCREDYKAEQEARKASRRAAREAREGPIPEQEALF